MEKKKGRKKERKKEIMKERKKEKQMKGTVKKTDSKKGMWIKLKECVFIKKKQEASKRSVIVTKTPIG